MAVVDLVEEENQEEEAKEEAGTVAPLGQRATGLVQRAGL